MKQSLFITLSIIFIAISCTKRPATPVPVTPAATNTLQITYSGQPITHRPIKFTSSAPAGSSFLWKFGDGAISTDAEPNHVYRIAGNYNPTLIINNDPANAAGSRLSIASTAKRMEGTYTDVGNIFGTTTNPWNINHETLTYPIAPSPVKFIVQTLTDTSVGVIDTFFGYSTSDKFTMKLIDSLTTDSTITFRYGPGYYLKYYFLSDHLYLDFIIYGSVPGALLLDSYKLR